MAKQQEVVISPGLMTPVPRPMDMATLRQDAFKLNLSYLMLARDLARQNMALAIKVFRLQEDVLQVIANAPPSYLSLAAQAISWNPVMKPAIPDSAWHMVAAVMNGGANAKDVAAYLADVVLR